MRYIVTPILTSSGVAYYVTDTSNNSVVAGGYGCETWAQHRADSLNRTPDTHLTAWTALLDRANHARPRRTAEDMEKAKWGRNRHGKG